MSPSPTAGSASSSAGPSSPIREFCGYLADMAVRSLTFWACLYSQAKNVAANRYPWSNWLRRKHTCRGIHLGMSQLLRGTRGAFKVCPLPLFLPLWRFSGKEAGMAVVTRRLGREASGGPREAFDFSGPLREVQECRGLHAGGACLTGRTSGFFCTAFRGTCPFLPRCVTCWPGISA